jgi:hypothetical protein
MKKWKFFSVPRAAVAALLSILFVFYAFNFIPRAIMILATRSLGRIVFDWVINFAVFFILIYLLASLATFIYQKLLKH